jgi:hypothetical protein
LGEPSVNNFDELLVGDLVRVRDTGRVYFMHMFHGHKQIAYFREMRGTGPVGHTWKPYGRSWIVFEPAEVDWIPRNTYTSTNVRGLDVECACGCGSPEPCRGRKKRLPMPDLSRQGDLFQ